MRLLFKNGFLELVELRGLASSIS